MELWLVRHGESTGNREGRMGGHSDDGLTALGQHQSQRLGQWWRQTHPLPTHGYCSPLRRAVDTWGQMVGADPTDWPAVTYTPALMEAAAGIFTGLTWAEAQAQYPDLCGALISQVEWIPIPGAEGPGAGRHRAEQFLHSLLNAHQGRDRVLIISHQWILEHLIASLLGCDRTWQLPMAPTALFQFRLDRPRWHQTGTPRYTRDLWQILHFGTRPHLERDGA